MRRPIKPLPIEFVVSEMTLSDSRGGVSIGVIVSPRFEGDRESKFEGSQGSLSIAIYRSSTTRKAAYEEAMDYFDELRKQEVLKERLKLTGKRKPRKPTA